MSTIHIGANPVGAHPIGADPEAATMISEADELVDARAKEIYTEAHRQVHCHTDRLFASLMVFQWILGVVAAFVVSPRTWAGAASEPHNHLYAAFVLGGIITALPVTLAILRPGQLITRHTIAIGQTLTSALLIHLSGGRIETHFHVFGSLAFLAFYRDWKVLVTASLVVSADHLLRGIYWPQSVYGILAGGEWRWLEHTLWVLFEDYFLLNACIRQVREMKSSAQHIARLERSRVIEEKLNQQLKVEIALRGRINQELEEFNYAASHDLQEPLRTMASFCTLLRRDVGTELTASAKEDLTFIEGATRRMQNLVQDILVLSRAGRTELKSEPVEIGACVAQVVQDLQVSITEAGANVEWQDLPTVLGDQASLTRVLQNLINNAIKFNVSPVPRVQITAQRHGAEWEIAVSDNGIGMEAAYLEQIFLPFKRLHSSSKFAGSGVGLSICRKLIERQAGRIAVRSVPDKGSTFRFYLPAIDSAATMSSDAGYLHPVHDAQEPGAVTCESRY